MNENKLRIGYFCLQAPVEGQASYAHVNEIISWLRAFGHDVVEFSPNNANGTQPSMMRKAWMFLCLNIRMIVRLREFDCIYVRSHFAASAVLVMARVFRRPAVVEINGHFKDLYIAYPMFRSICWVVDPLTTMAFRCASGFVAVTEPLAAWLRKDLGLQHVDVIPNGANTKIFCPSAREFELPSKAPYALFFGALAPWQGVSTMLEAVTDNCWPSDLHLVFCGDGAERSKIQRAAEKNPKVHYEGIVPYRKLPEYVTGSLVGLSVQNAGNGRSEFGLFPLKAMETLSSGVPVIMSRFPGASEEIEAEEVGLVIPAEDGHELAKAVKWLWDNPRSCEEMGLRGRQMVLEKHSWEIRAKETEKVMMRSMNRGRN